MLPSEAGEGPFEGRLLASAACEVCACKRHCPDLPRDVDGRWMKNIRENLMKLDGKWWTLRNNDKNWWTLRRSTDYTPSQFKLSEVMLWDLAALASILATASFVPVAMEGLPEMLPNLGSWPLSRTTVDIRLRKKTMDLAVSGHTKHSGT